MRSLVLQAGNGTTIVMFRSGYSAKVAVVPRAHTATVAMPEMILESFMRENLSFVCVRVR